MIARCRPVAAVSVTALVALLAACQKPVPHQVPGEVATPISALPRATSSAGPAPAPMPARADCGPSPRLALLADKFADPDGLFADNAPARAELETNFARAYVAACVEGALRGHALVDPRASHRDALFLVNAPDANAPSISFDASQDTPGGARETVLAYPFIDADHQPHVPNVRELTEAIDCALPAGTAKGDDERCLVD